MRIRSIKPEFWRSRDIAALAIEDRLLFIGLWSYVDDNGVGRDEDALIAADLFAHDLSVNPHDTLMRIHGGLMRLHAVGLIVRYEVDSAPYLEVTTWERHQKINRPSPGRYPKSDHDSARFSESSVSPHNTLSAGAGEQRSRGTGEENTCSPAPPSSERVTRFDEFWDAYPRKVGKQKARTKYATAVKRAGDEQTVIDGAHRLANDPNLPEQKFIPHPTTWLERDGWEDEPLPARFDMSASDRNLQRGAQIAQRYAQAPQPPSLNDNPFEADIKEIRA